MKILFAISGLLLLTACSSNEPVYDENNLPPGIMQPVNGTGSGEGIFTPQIEQQSMPVNMQ